MTFYEKYYSILNIDSNDLVIKELADHVLSVAEQYIYSRFSYSLFERTVTETISGANSPMVFVSKAPITFLYINYLNGEPYPLPTKISTHTLLYAENIKSGFNNFTIQYKVGFSDPLNAPSDIVNAIFSIAKKLYRDMDKETDSYTNISSDIKQSIKPIDDIPFLTKQILFNYLPMKL